MKWTRLLALGVVVAVAALVLLFGFAEPAMAQGWEQGAWCVHSYVAGATCTANDVRLEELRTTQLLEGCAQGTPGSLLAVFEARVSAGGSPARYDIGYFISLDGRDAKDAAGQCFHGYLAPPPPLTQTPYYDRYTGVFTPTLNTIWNTDPNFIGWWNGEPKATTDTCGDMDTNTQVVKQLEIALRLPCVDLVDGAGNAVPDGFVDVGVCASWDNNSNTLCTTVKGAVPGTGSKCSCTRVNLPYEAPLAVDLATFSAAPQEGGVLLSWETATELDNLGFNLYRAGSPDGALVRLNKRLIPSQAPGSATGASYSFLDETAAAGQTYYYWLEDVDVNGLATKDGPVDAKMPVARTLPGRPRPLPIPALLSVVASLVVWAVTKL